MRRKHSRFTIVLGRNSLRKDGLIQFLRSADFGTVTSVTRVDDLCASRTQPGEVLYVLVHTGDDFEATVEQIEPLRSRYPNGRVVMVADRYRLNESTAAFRAGANGYFVDVTTPDVFIKSIELVMMGETVFPPAFLPFADPKREHNNDGSEAHNGAAVTPDKNTAPQLSPREKLILHCLIEGDSNKRIARRIDIAEGTVKVHIKAILRKIGARNRTQAAIWAMNERPLASRAQNRLPNPTSDVETAHNKGCARNQMDALVSLDVKGARDEEPERNDFGPDSGRALDVLPAHPFEKGVGGIYEPGGHQRRMDR